MRAAMPRSDPRPSPLSRAAARTNGVADLPLASGPLILADLEAKKRLKVEGNSPTSNELILRGGEGRGVSSPRANRKKAGHYAVV